MALAAFDAPLSYRDWLAFPDDGHQYEVVEGIPVVNPSPNVPHAIVSVRLAVILSAAAPAPFFVLAAPMDWVLRADRPAHVRQPDLVVVGPDQVDYRAVVGTPLLAVEILSPSSRERDLVTKRRIYAHAGCRHYWIVDPDPDEPGIVAFHLVSGTYDEAGRAVGDQPLVLHDPFPVTVVPSALVAGVPRP